MAPAKKPAENNGRTAYSYVRFSSAAQAQGDSLRRQTAWAKTWCEENGYVLDTTLKMTDAGVSAYRGKNATEGCLGAFIQCIEAGKVSPGSVLLVENLDRLTRQNAMPAIGLVSNILQGGVEIITRDGRLTTDSDMGAVMWAVVTLCRGNSESQAKSMRSSDNWKHKREHLSNTPMTGKAPAWLTLVDGKWAVDETKAAAVRRIFALASEGMGRGAIARLFNREGYPAIGRAKEWHASYIGTMLNGKAVLGEFQPHTGIHGNSKPVGKPIANYFPAIVEEHLYYAVQAAQHTHKTFRGRRGHTGASNLFQGLLVDARDNHNMTMVNKKPGTTDKQIVSYGAMRGSGASYLTFPYDALEQGLLSFISELTAGEFAVSDNSKELTTLEGKDAEIETKLDKIAKAMMGDGEFDTLMRVQAGLEANRKVIRNRLDTLRAKQNTPHADTLGETHSIIKQLGTAMGPALADMRIGLQGRIRLLIATILVYIVRTGIRRRAYVNVHYRSGGKRLVILDTEKGQLQRAWGWQRQHEKLNRAIDLSKEEVRDRLSKFGFSIFPWKMGQ
ncbi:MAG: recombinase family protein [Planctomycetota bacterium]|nr:recombinase family protein [Planctomycetota bacterium]